MPAPLPRTGGLLVLLVVLGLSLTGCGGSRATSAALVAQPTPDPTLDAVVRSLPRMLAGAAATATPVPPTLVPRPAATPVPSKPRPVPTPTVKPRR